VERVSADGIETAGVDRVSYLHKVSPRTTASNQILGWEQSPTPAP